MSFTHYSVTGLLSREQGQSSQQADTSKEKKESLSLSITDFDRALAIVLRDVGKLLSEKNRLYGNAYFEPTEVFSKLTPLERIDARIDEKLARIKSAQNDDQEDTTNDLIGLLVIRKICLMK
jgi:hypothetical protein